MQYMAWSLFIFCSRCFKPGTETPQLMMSVQTTFYKLTDMLKMSMQMNDEQLIKLILLSLAHVVHMTPPGELTV